jgi:two-component system, NtrC family, response regulator AtoC
LTGLLRFMTQTQTLNIQDLPGVGFVSGQGTCMSALNKLAANVACTNIPVLICGESGTGKEVYARHLHELSGQSTPLRKFNCSLADSGALRRELTSGFRSESPSEHAETLLLDAIDELDLDAQRIVASLLSENDLNLRGSYPVLGRVISTASRDLESLTNDGRFRKELYFRINGLCLNLPPLRERKEDIPDLLTHFLQKHAGQLNKRIPELNQGFHETLLGYDWPGNIRELENLARKMVVLGDGGLALNDFRATPRGAFPSSVAGSSPALKIAARVASRNKERELILAALERTKWNRKRAARDLQISYKALLYKLKQIGISGSGGAE